jgi:hypothetical protein
MPKLTAVPEPPKRYSYVVQGDRHPRLTLRDIEDLLTQARAERVPDDFYLVNSGSGVYTLRSPF